MIILFLLMASFVHHGRPGSPCPKEDISPWFCVNTPTTRQDIYTTFICNRHKCERRLEKAAGHFIIDRIMISDVKKDKRKKSRGVIRLPPNWLWTSRVRELEIRSTPLSGCFLCDSPLSGQEYYLNKLVASNCFLSGKVCTDCKKSKVFDYGHITAVDITGLRHLRSLRVLDFSFNKLEELSNTSFPSSLTSLKTLVLSHNIISDISSKAFTQLPSLAELDLSYNQINNLSRDMFSSPNVNLKVLNLSWNKLSLLPENIFSFMFSLREVVFTNNLLQFLPSTTWNQAPTAIHRIDVTGNFLICDCHMKWIVTNLTSRTRLHGSCSAPWKMVDKYLKHAAGIMVCE
ncbi:slit homolog 2 protein-like [Limulus polyphemus]|uniref:Slit homolog 2 protein-like n=1 Tax=Limulus polyphemus TaxID=6850 RepID=A0ABM1T6C1_LIMPO|nr:slit homolog 2 protein-like [Limulus polyphemus]